MLRLVVHSLLPCSFWTETHKYMKNNVKKGVSCNWVTTRHNTLYMNNNIQKQLPLPGNPCSN